MATLKVNEDLKKLISDYVLNLAYPIGSIYIAVNNTNPKDLFGGTWERITGGFIYGRTDESWMLERGNGSGCWTNEAGGGTTYEHTLTIDQIPSHRHDGVYENYSQKQISNRGDGGGGWNNVNISGITGSQNGTYSFLYTGSTGGGKGHSHNLASHGHDIPYIGCYVWKRTA